MRKAFALLSRLQEKTGADQVEMKLYGGGDFSPKLVFAFHFGPWHMAHAVSVSEVTETYEGLVEKMLIEVVIAHRRHDERKRESSRHDVSVSGPG